jgi:pimeloyl-ACP methyl ester carboxylesterase
MGREVRYCTTEDGVRIAYCVEGEGPPIVVTPYFVESFSLDHLVPEFQEFLADLGAGHKIVRYDGRGVGLAQRTATDWSQDATVLDLAAVADAAGLDRFSIWASTAGGSRAIKFAVSHPERVQALLLYGAYPAIRMDGPGYSEGSIRAFAELAKGNWPLASQMFADMTGRKEFPEAAVKIADWYRQSSDGDCVHDIILGTLGFDVTPILAELQVRTLILHRVNDPSLPFAIARELASRIPDSRFVPLPGPGHIYYLGETAPVLNAVHAFLDEDPETRALPTEPAVKRLDSAFHAILFTDLVGHTEMMSRLGDERGRGVLREHEDITRNVLKQYGGTEVKTMGDGFMASFGLVTKAVECAVALQRAFAEREGEPLAVRPRPECGRADRGGWRLVRGDGHPRLPHRGEGGGRRDTGGGHGTRPLQREGVLVCGLR